MQSARHKRIQSSRIPASTSRPAFDDASLNGGGRDITQASSIDDKDLTRLLRRLHDNANSTLRPATIRSVRALALGCVLNKICGTSLLPSIALGRTSRRMCESLTMLTLLPTPQTESRSMLGRASPLQCAPSMQTSRTSVRKGRCTRALTS